MTYSNDVAERAKWMYERIREAFISRGGTPEQWERVRNDPRKFNLAWNRLLGLPDSTFPPPENMRNIDTFLQIKKNEAKKTKTL